MLFKLEFVFDDDKNPYLYDVRHHAQFNLKKIILPK